MERTVLYLAVLLGILSMAKAQDTTPPVVINCPPNQNTRVDNLGDTGVVTWTPPTATDDSGDAVTTTQSHFPGTAFPVGFTAVTYVFRDSSNNPAVCSFVVSVGLNGDNNPPVISDCPTSFTIFVATSNSIGTPTWTAPSASDETGQTQFTTNLSPLTALSVGTYPVTYTFEDPSGNSDTCEFEVTIAVGTPDVTDPVLISCPQNIAVGNNGQNFVLVTWDAPSALDDSGVVNQLSGPATTSQFYQAGSTNTISYVLYDPSGNSVTCSFTVTVAPIGSSSTGPVITGCPEDVNLQVPSATIESVSISWEEPTVTEESGPVTSSSTHQPGEAFDVDTSTIVAYVFTDEANNNATCSFVVTLTSPASNLDNTDPVIVGCPSDIVVDAVFGSSDVSVTWTEPSATDDSGSVSSTQSANPGDSFPFGSTEVEYVFSDSSGNMATCTFNVIVSAIADIQDPVITDCPIDVILMTPSGVTDVSVVWTEPIATDDSGSVALVASHSPGDVFPVGLTTVIYTFSDASGNSATCSFNVTITSVDGGGDTSRPVISGCPEDIILEIPSASITTIAVSWSEPTATDDSGSVQTASSHQPGDAFAVGTTTLVTYTFSDDAGNTADCSFNIIISSSAITDNVDPVISGCPDDINIDIPIGSTGVAVTWTEPTATDNSGVVPTFTSTSSPGDTFGIGATQVSYTFTDGSGNNAFCIFTVTVSATTDNVDPVITGCPDNINIAIPIGSSGVAVTWTEPTATDNSGVVPTFTSTSSPGDTFGVGTTQVSYTFTDGSGNNAFCVFTVTVSATTDNVDPVITGCPDNINIAIPIGSTGVAVTWTEPTATDNSGVVPTFTSTSSPGDTFGVGTTQVSYTFTDGSGNNAFCIFTVSVSATTDNVDPVITGCPDNINIAIPIGSTGVAVTWTEPTATDNSGVVPTFTSTSSPGDTFGVGTTQVSYTFTDGSGNNAFCIFTVSVSATTDNVDPVITGCPDNINIAIPIGSTGVAVTWTEPTATDNSGVVPTSTSTSSPGDVFGVGTTQVSYTFTDGSGNNAFCVFTVTISATTDNVDPVITGCPDNINIAIPIGSTGVAVTWTEPTATDNSGIVPTFTSTSSPGDVFGVGTTQVSYTFTDGSGNNAFCVFTVTVSATTDNVDPVISGCPDNINIAIPIGSTGVAVTWTEPTATDNSGIVPTSTSTSSPGDTFNVGTTQVSYTFTDGSGNNAFCIFTVSVSATTDNVDPVITGCPDNINIAIPIGSTGVSVTWTEPTATDNSGVVPTSTSTSSPGDVFGVGATQVSYTFTDGSGNNAFCIFTVTVSATTDNVDPVITGCPDNINIAIPIGSTGVAVTWTEPTATDNSGVVPTFTSTSSPGDVFGVGTTQVSYTFTDGSGNNAFCIFTVTISATTDNVDPVITGCPDNINIAIPIGSTGVAVTWTEPTATDNSGVVPTFTSTSSPGDVFGVGTTQVSYTFTDGSGNNAFCIFTVSISATTDNVDPVITGCPDNINIAIPIGSTGVAVTWTEPTATDNSGVVPTFTSTSSPGDVFGVGTTQVSYTFTDGSGNNAFCVFTVTISAISDNTEPVITGCPDDISVVAPSGSTGVAITWPEPTASDDSGPITTESTSSPGDSFNIGMTTVSYTFTDDSGNFAICSFSVTVSASADNTDPVITGCPDDITVVVPSGSTSVAITWSEPSATDDSGPVTSESSRSPGDSFDVGMTVVSYTFTDMSGNFAICSFSVTVAAEADTTVPVIENCPSSFTVDAGSNSFIFVTWTEPTATDDSGTVTLVSGPSSNSGFYPAGSINEVTYVFQDTAGNEAECSFTVTVAATTDNTDPVITGCPDNINVVTDLGASGATVSWTAPSATDNSGQIPSSTSDRSPGDFFNVGTTQVTYTFTDGSGNNAFCSFFVTVEATLDNTDPVISGCPENILVEIPSGSTGVSVSWNEPTATDNSGVVPTFTSTSSPGDVFGVGTTQVTYTFTDGSGNDAFCTFFVTVAATTDNTDPVIENCPESFSVDAGNNAFVFVFWTAPTATDESGTVTQVAGPSSNNGFYQAGTVNDVLYVFEDEAGNQAQCAFQVTVTATVDNTDPVITNCPNNFAVQTTLNGAPVQVSWNEPSATDDSGDPVQVTQTANSGDFFSPGTTAVTYTFTDTSGNDAMCTFTVTVTTTVDVTAPVINDCPSDITVQTTLGGTAVALTWTEPTATDDSGSVSSTSTSNPGDSFPVGTTVVVYTFSDDAGNSAVCSFTVTVEATVDVTAPVINDCPSDITVQTTLGGTAVALTWTEPTATDDSGSVSSTSTSNPGDSFPVGTTVVVYTFSDDAGNSAVCSFTVTVEATVDVTAPVINDCPSDITVQTTLGGTAVALTWTEPTATDDSGSVSSTSTSNPGDSFPVGTTVVVYTFSDDAGNSAVCSFTVTVEANIDVTAPIINNCPEDITVQTTLDGAAVAVTWSEPTATDDSGTVTSTSSSNPGDSFPLGTTSVVYTFTDDSGNAALCTFTVSVEGSIDNNGPVISGCPDDIIVNSVANNNQVSVSWLEPTAVDDSGQVPSVVSSSSPGDLFPIGSTVVSYTFVDGSNNPSACSFTVTVIDNNGPVISNCPMDISRSVPFGISGTTVSWTPPTAVDNSGSNVIVSSNNNPGDFFGVGLSQVTYTFTDAQGNPSQCSFNVIVFAEGDNIDPVIVGCPGNIVVDSDPDSNGASVTWTPPVATDNSGNTPTVTQTATPGSTFLIGETTVMYTFTDNAGNFAVCSFNVIVNDETSPVILNCPQDIPISVPFGTTRTVVTWAVPTATDNSGGAVQSTSTANPGDVFAIGVTQVSYTFTDADNNPAVCAFNIFISALGDTVDPVISNCPPNLAVTADSSLNGAFVTWTEPSATDNSGTVNSVSSASPNDFFLIGETTVTYTFVDPSGNDAICSFNIVVSDDTNPMINNCPGDIPLSVPFGVSAAVVTWTVPSATDNSGFVSLTSNSANPGDSFPVGNTQVVYIFTDDFNNDAICTFEISIMALGDVTIPVISDCPPSTIVVEADANLPGASVDWTIPTAVDNDGNPPQVTVSNPPGFFTIGSTTVTYTFRDTAGNEAFCIFDVVVIDNTNPVVTSCPDNINLDVPFGTTSTAVSWQSPLVSDNSGTFDTVNNANPGDLFTAGTVTQVSYTFTDPSNNFEVCNFLVTINIGADMTDPVIIGCPQNIAEVLPDDSAAVAITWTPPTATDNSGQVPSLVATANSGDLFAIGTTTVTYTFRDLALNEATCSFTVTVFDQTGPTFLFCPDDITLVVSLGTPTAVATWTEPVAQDNSGTVNFVDQSHASGDEFPAGSTTTVTYRYEDGSNNPGFCSFQVIVNTMDDARPVIDSCPPNIAVEVEIGVGGTPVTWVIPTATDNSGVAPTVENNFNPGDFFDVGSTLVVYTFTDGAGNEAQCAFNVAVTGVDTTPPLIQSCPGDISLTTDVTTSGRVVSWDAPIVADASGDPISIVVSMSPGTFFEIGTTTVMYTFVDSSGNSISCDFDVTITSTDEEGPVISGCPGNILRTVLDDTTGGVINWTPPVATDNSGEEVQLLSNPPTPGSYFPIGTTTVTYSYSDGAGNIRECTFDIIIDQDTPCDANPCENGGVCLAQSLTDYVCVCPGCFTGDNCQFELDPCNGNTCVNGGQCVQYDNSCTRYYCECPECFYGEFCENRVDACACNKCENGGVCSPLAGGTCTDYNCLCTGCFVGQFCENEYNPCDYAPCQNGGLCSNIADSCSAYSCECQGCFTGYSCEIAIPNPCDEDPCANGGVCSRIAGSCYAYQCACQPGFAGPRCEDAVVTLVNPCNNFPCENGASCVCDNAQNYVCLCPPGFNGIHCEVGLVTSQDACANDPCLNGNCVNSYHSGTEVLGVYSPQYTCVCPDGFTGPNCALTSANNPSLVVCDDNKCENGGVCYNTYYSYDQSVSYFCECPIGFFGECCELTHPNPCNSNPCTVNGNCLAFNTYFVCSCLNGYSGVTCEVPPNDITRPVLDCPDSISVPATTTSGGAVVTWNLPTVTDDSGNWGFVSVNSESGAYYAIGTVLPVTYRYVDGAGNFATCTFTISVTELDNINPEIQQCPEDIEITLPPGGLSTVVSWLEPFATDNFAVVSTDNNFSPGDNFDLGSTVVSYTFTDAAGNFDVCTFTVTIGAEPDVSPPAITNCPGDLTIEVGPGTVSSVATWIEPSATDNVGVITTINNFNPGDIFNVGTTRVTYSFGDAAGNPASCSFDVTVIVGEDQDAPIIQNCPGNIAIFVGVGITETAVTWIEPSAVDNSIGAIAVENNYAPGDDFPLGATLVSYTFTDLAGNFATCEFFVGLQVAVDDVDPVISNCPGNVLLSVAQGVTSVTASWVPPTAVDNSGTVNTESNFIPGNVFGLGSTVVTYTFTDPSGNLAICAFEVIVTVAADVIPPVISNCPGAINVEVSSSLSTASVSWDEPTAEDESGIVLTSQNFNPGQLFGVGTTAVTYTFTDQAGNPAICTFVVTVTAVDDIAPVIIGCPNTITYEAPLGATRAPVTWNPPTVTEGGVVTSQTSTPGSLFPLGSSQVTYTFTDPLGNVATCSFSVVVITVMDNTRPVLVSCPDDISVRVDVGLTGGTASWTVPNAVDDSGTVNVASNYNPGDFFELGSTLVAYTLSDDEGNSINCDFFVIVTAATDDIMPVISGCPDDVILYVPQGTTRANVFWTEPTATDNFGDVTVTRSATPGSLFLLGQRQVTYTFRDEANNIAFCTFDVIVQVAPVDDVSPVLVSCPGDITVATSDQNTAVPAFWLVPQAIDNSGNVNVLNNNNPGDLFSLGVNTVTYTFTDNAGNDVICSFDVTVVLGVVDTTDPIVNFCPANMEILTPVGEPEVVVTWNEPVAFDNSGSVTTTQSASPGDTFGEGVTQVVYQFTDASGNDAFCIFTITVTLDVQTDFEGPVISNCPDDFILSVPAGIATVSATWQEPSATDASLPISLEQSASPGDEFPVGQTTLVTYTFTDALGNPTICAFSISAVVVIVDNTDPVISNCPDDIDLSVPPTLANVALTWIEPSATDDTTATANIRIDQTASPGDSFPAGQTTIVSYTFTDEAGNFAVCTFQITINVLNTDTTNPVVSNCPDPITLSVGAGVTSVPVVWTEPTAVDETSAVTVSQTASPGDSFGLGQNLVSYTFTDAAGNDAFCTFTITITVATDNIRPVISGCPDDISVTIPSGSNGVAINWTPPTATDNSGEVPTVISSSSPGDTFEVGTTVVSYTFTDGSGNNDICLFTVTVAVTSGDNIDPVITGCPENMVVTIPSGFTEASVTWIEPTATDNSPDPVRVDSSSSPGDSFTLGSTAVTYTFTDSSGNFAVCLFIVTVQASVDNTIPVVSNCPNPITLNVGAGVTSVPVVWTEPTAVDETSAVTVSQTASPGDSFGLGENLVSYTFTDAAGNNAFCIFTITITGQTVVDNTPPVISGCPNDIDLTVPAGTTSIPLTWTEPTAVDETSAVTRTRTAAPGTSFAVGTSTDVTYTFTDASGNFDICTFTVTLTASSVDQTPPVISGCPPGITVTVQAGVSSTAVSWVPPTATDEVSAVTFTTTNAPGSLFGLGSTQVTYTFTDQAGNDAFCTFNVIVATSTTDNTDPVITGCPEDITITDIGLDGTQVATWVEPSATDNSAVTVTRTNSPGDAFVLGTTTVTYTFTDTSNNFAICAFDVTVTENTPCDSNPCPVDEQCFYSADTYLCLPQAVGRRRREAEDISMTGDCPCLNDGVCKRDHNDNNICFCKPGFYGPICENEIVVLDPCQPNPCGSNGTCRHTPRGSTLSFVCDCAAGYSGKYCEKSEMKSLTDEQMTSELQEIIGKQTLISWAFLAGCFILVLTILLLLIGLACLAPRFRTTVRTGKPALDEITLVQ
ncbi:mucin-17-like isoform X7 [Lytechinus variegatus]|uniref:mucin-17-like isoform X7 n=1 Tax=Lytechinus variegatus TaxID=7654 RepID=UPI001BB2B3B5|nr:mucin-17-like isoform X7 [Lytechinus variegatus]